MVTTQVGSWGPQCLRIPSGKRRGPRHGGEEQWGWEQGLTPRAGIYRHMVFGKKTLQWLPPLMYTVVVVVVVRVPCLAPLNLAGLTALPNWYPVTWGFLSCLKASLPPWAFLLVLTQDSLLLLSWWSRSPGSGSDYNGTALAPKQSNWLKP